MCRAAQVVPGVAGAEGGDTADVGGQAGGGEARDAGGDEDGGGSGQSEAACCQRRRYTMHNIGPHVIIPCLIIEGQRARVV